MFRICGFSLYSVVYVSDFCVFCLHVYKISVIYAWEIPKDRTQCAAMSAYFTSHIWERRNGFIVSRLEIFLQRICECLVGNLVWDDILYILNWNQFRSHFLFNGWKMLSWCACFLFISNFYEKNENNLCFRYCYKMSGEMIE